MEARELVTDLLKSGMTQAAIAEKTGIPQPTISKISRGDVDDVMSRNYRKLQALHAELLGSDGAPEVPAPAEASAEQAGG